MQNKKAFSFTEIIIIIFIIAFFVVILLSYNGASNQKAQNTRAIGDLETLNNSLVSYLKDTKSLPEPQGNKNYYNSGSEYVHDKSLAFGVHGFATQNLLPKKYLNYLPLDPRTNQYYAYGKTIDNKFYEVAGVVNIDGKYTTKLMGNYPGENGPFSLIREYNGPNFISDNSRNSFPYNPEEKLLVAKINNVSGSVNINGTITGSAVLEHTLIQGDTITVPAGGTATIFFTDGSQSVLGDTSRDSKLTLSNMQFKEDDNLLTRIKLSLESGTLWTKATKLNQDSEFEVQTQDTTASVRGTIFGINYNGKITKIQVEKGEVVVKPEGKISQSIKKGENYNGIILYDISNFKTNLKIINNKIPSIKPKKTNSLTENSKGKTDKKSLSKTIPRCNKSDKILGYLLDYNLGYGEKKDIKSLSNITTIDGNIISGKKIQNGELQCNEGKLTIHKTNIEIICNNNFSQIEINGKIYCDKK